MTIHTWYDFILTALGSLAGQAAITGAHLLLLNGLFDMLAAYAIFSRKYCFDSPFLD